MAALLILSYARFVLGLLIPVFHKDFLFSLKLSGFLFASFKFKFISQYCSNCGSEKKRYFMWNGKEIVDDRIQKIFLESFGRRKPLYITWVEEKFHFERYK